MAVGRRLNTGATEALDRIERSLQVGPPPIDRASLLNVAGYIAAADILGVALAPLNTPCTFRVEVAFDAGGILSATITRGGVTVVSHFQYGSALNIDSGYRFSLAVSAGERINYRYSVNATILNFKVQEIPAAAE